MIEQLLFDQTAFATACILCLMGTSFYTWRIIDHIEDHREYSLTRFFTDDRGLYAFEIVTAACVIASFGLLYASLGALFNAPVLDALARGPMLLLFLALLYFARTSAQITTKPTELGAADDDEADTTDTPGEDTDTDDTTADDEE